MCSSRTGFSFLLLAQKKRNKEKAPAALFWLFPRLFPLNKKNSLRSNSFLFLTLQQPPPFHAKKDEAGTLCFSCRNIASLVVRTFVILRNKVTKDLSTSPKQAKQRLVNIHSRCFRHEWRSVKKLARFSVKKKKHESIQFRPHRRSVKKFSFFPV